MRTGALRGHSPFNLLDGPLSQVSNTEYTQDHYRLIVASVAVRRATVIAVALSAYRREHGQYPLSLQALLGEYLDAIPLDPYDDQPIRYVQKPEEDGFLLYCVGSDQVDDGGTPPAASKPGQPGKTGDFIFRHKRSTDLYCEIKLENVKP